jgi:hypothetical protein
VTFLAPLHLDAFDTSLSRLPRVWLLCLLAIRDSVRGGRGETYSDVLVILGIELDVLVTLGIGLEVLITLGIGLDVDDIGVITSLRVCRRRTRWARPKAYDRHFIVALSGVWFGVGDFNVIRRVRWPVVGGGINRYFYGLSIPSQRREV